MNRAVLVTVLLTILTVTSVQARTQGAYISGTAGLSLLSDSDASIPGLFNAEVSFDPGFRVGGALGYDYGLVRLEGEISYRSNDTDEGFILGFGTGPVDGDVSALSFMANGYYDFGIGTSPVTPYLGFGVGVAQIDADITVPNLTPLALIDDSAIVFAYQLMAGIGFNVSPNAVISFDYRYYATTDPEFTPGPGFIPGLPDIKAEYSNHSFNVGVQLYF